MLSDQRIAQLIAEATDIGSQGLVRGLHHEDRVFR
jgi:hypothetical protein